LGRLAFRLPCLPYRRKQRQLIGRELFAFAVALGLQQLAQQALDFGSFSGGAIQLRDQIQHDLL
jgi:hypothetical protein